MGSCASVEKGSDSTMWYGIGSVGTKAKRIFISSPVKEKTVNGFRSKSIDFGSKDEVFFDSRAWLDSDCDDDFYSVNGDFTPSRGSTPIHSFSGASTPKLDSSLLFNNKPVPKPEPSPTGRKKLLELFHESIRSEEPVPDATDSSEETVSVNLKSDVLKQSDLPEKSVNGTPCRSGSSSACSSATSVASPNRNIKNKKEKIWKTANCCLPSLHNFGFDERRQKMNPQVLAA